MKAIKKTTSQSTLTAKPTKTKLSMKVATKKQVKTFLEKGLKQYKRTIKALEDK